MYRFIALFPVFSLVLVAGCSNSPAKNAGGAGGQGTGGDQSSGGNPATGGSPDEQLPAPDATAGPEHNRDAGVADASKPGPGDGGTSPVLFTDDFEGSSQLLNTKGVGGGWFGFAINDLAVEEANDTLNVTLAQQHSSYGLANSTLNFNFWNNEGVVAEFVIKETTVISPHQFGNYLAFLWQFGIISADRIDRRSFKYWQGSRFKDGGLWFSIGRKDSSDAAELWVSATNKTVPLSDAELHLGDPGYEEIVRIPFKIKYPMTIRIHMDSQGWRVELPGQVLGNQKTSFNWGSDMKRAPITTEFQNGAFLLVHPRIAGLTGAGTGTTPLGVGKENSGKLERVTVVKPGNR